MIAAAPICMTLAYAPELAKTGFIHGRGGRWIRDDGREVGLRA